MVLRPLPHSVREDKRRTSRPEAHSDDSFAWLLAFIGARSCIPQACSRCRWQVEAMAAFKKFEIEAIRLLTANVLSAEALSQVEQASALDDYEYTGCGYFATLRHESLPIDRVVCHELKVIGESRGIKVGFILFLENHELMLECHDWGIQNIPADFREQDVRIEIET
jgi:hypothetical protein